MNQILYLIILCLGFSSCTQLSEPCIISKIEVTVGECLTDSTYRLTVNFSVENAGNNYFELYTRNNNWIGYYSLSELPLTIDNFPLSGKDFDYLKVCINDKPDCCEETEFKAPDCSDKECSVGELQVEVGDCTGEGRYNLHLNFAYENPGNDFFNVYVRDNQLIGTYKLADLPIKIENFETSGKDYDFIKVCINDHPDCCGVAEFKAPDCSDKGCSVGELQVEVGDCTDEGTYNLHLNFAYENPGNDFFNVYVRDNQLIGTYKLADLPIKIENFETSGKDYDFIKVCINDHPDCCRVAEFEAPDCSGGSCEISELNLTVGECVNDSTYQLTINFEVQNPGNQYFEVYTRNEHYVGYFRLSELPLTLPEFKKSGKEYDYVKVCINDHPDCCKAAEIKSPDCE
ncbi:MAG: hypothetical protein ACK5M7_09790 [Draconibacterium sp.]